MSFSIFQAAAEAPRRTAMIAAGDAVTFSDLAAEVGAAIGWLRGRGVDASTPRAALLGEASREALILFYSLAELGVPALMVHPRSTAAERERWLADTATDVLLDPCELPQGSPGGGQMRHSPEGGQMEHFPEAAPDLPVRPVDPETPLAIVRTSGTGGRPKGVVLSRRAFVAAARASAHNLGWREDDRWLSSLPIAHVGGLSIVSRCLLARRTIVVEPAERFDPETAANLVEERHVTLISLVPTMLRRLLDLDGWQPPAHLRAILLGGAAASPTLLARAAERGWPVLVTYGLTEACSQVATQPYGTVQRGELGCGPPVDGMEARIRGEVVEIRGASLLSGYLPAATGSPVNADGWFRTGDLGEIDAAGNLHVLGRRDQVIVTGGENVQPLEVEQALEEHPAISAACVFGVPDDEWGQAVAAALVLTAEAAASGFDAGEWSRALAKRLVSYKRPRRVAWLDELPRTAAGKPDRPRIIRLARFRLRAMVP